MTGRLAEAPPSDGPDGLPRTAWLAIDLDALRSNLATIRSLAGSGAPVHPVVKADAYGHGAVPVARALEAAGVEGFCVAAVDEAVELRRAGVRRPILVLYPIPPRWAAVAARRRIAISAGDFDLLAATLDRLAGANLPRLAVQLEVETGLGRGGLRGDALVDAARRVAESRVARLTGLWTHLQAPADGATTVGQLGAFEAAAASLRAAGLAVARRHVRASGGLLARWVAESDAVAATDGVRPGLALYGLVPDELAAGDLAPPAGALRPVLSLRARPVRVASLPAGWGISYGPSHRLSGERRIATLPLGYGDGWPRALSNRASALVRGTRVPLVGTVAMDAVMADVTDVPGPPVDPADEFVLIGRQGGLEISVAELARERTTNSWEVVTAFARRLPRVYHAASGPVAVRTLVAGGNG